MSEESETTEANLDTVEKSPVLSAIKTASKGRFFYGGRARICVVSLSLQQY